MKNFDTNELVSKEIYEALGERSLRLFDPFTLKALDNIRDAYGKPIVINNWSKGGNYTQSGLRELNSPVGAPRSKHKEAIAFDCKVGNLREFYKFVTTTPGLNITRVEHIDATPSWCHIEIGPNELLPRIFRP